MTSKPRRPLSLETQLRYGALVLLLVFAALLGWLMLLLKLSLLAMLTLWLLLLVPAAFGFWRFYQRIVTPFYSLTSLVEAIRLEDYNLRIREHYHSGILASLTQELDALANDLQQRKQRYDQYTLLIYHLIEQLDAPIAIFNEKLQLSHANAAFSGYIKQPWQSKRLCSSAQLGLVLTQDNRWQFSEHEQAARWQLKQSQFMQQQQTYHLVVLNNVETLLRKNQLRSWQQIIRVLSHEIRNSLTPIKSLAQTLKELPCQDQQSRQALSVIVEHSSALQDFVNRYSDISRRLQLNHASIAARSFIDSILSLFPAQQFNLDIQCEKIWADPVLLKQVLINLIKNAVEATVDNNREPASDSQALLLHIYLAQPRAGEKTLCIELVDQGCGIANPENLFVPFYTTKAQGKGIGLSFCQNIIEQHGGRLTLVNNSHGHGATACIQLPYAH